MYHIPVGFHYRVEFGRGEGDDDHRFQEVSGLGIEISTEEFKEGGQNLFAHKLPAGIKHNNLVLKRGFFTDSEIIGWVRDAVENFRFEPTDMTVTLLDEEHNPLQTWKFTRAYPVKWSVSDLKGQENGLVIESLEMSYQMMRKG
jgi:phage tail-like protein